MKRILDACCGGKMFYFDKPFKEGGIIDAKGSADSMIKWIKKELSV